jgi:hypothetical protein
MAVCTAILITHFVAAWIGLPKDPVTYRRIGPKTGPQVFIAGSSLIQFGLSWSDISKTLKQGMENWGVAGSSPVEWEVSQGLETNSNAMIIGVSVYDLNEYHLCDSRADIVPILQTIHDLRSIGADWQFSKRVLSQYPLALFRHFFPTAGKSDAVLVGLRSKLYEQTRIFSENRDTGNSLVLPSKAVLDFGESNERVSDWSRSKTLRRLALLRAEIQGKHEFGGLKQLAFQRMLQKATQIGSVYVVVMPVAPAYASEFVTAGVTRDFENSLAHALHYSPQASVFRLDQVKALHSDKYYTDLVHLNSAGRSLATKFFLMELSQGNTPKPSEKVRKS